MDKVTNPKELAKAIKNNESSFEITVDLKNKVVKLKAVGKIAWGIAFTAIGGAVALYLATPAATAVSAPAAGAGGVISFTGGTVAATGAVTILGLSATTFAISVGIAAGGVGAITKLRDNYKIEEKAGRYFMVRK